MNRALRLAARPLGALTYTRRWKWRWTEWLTTVDHKKLGVMSIIDALARKTFRYSIVYLSLLFAALLVDHYTHALIGA
jgi:cytochrome o ubiquinol oxidase subunit 1